MSAGLQANTEAGARFVAIAEGHVDAFRGRAATFDAEGGFPVENFDDLKKSGGIFFSR